MGRGKYELTDALLKTIVVAHDSKAEAALHPENRQGELNIRASKLKLNDIKERIRDACPHIKVKDLKAVKKPTLAGLLALIWMRQENEQDVAAVTMEDLLNTSAETAAMSQEGELDDDSEDND